MLKLHLQQFAEDPADQGGGAEKIQIGDKEFTLEELQEQLKSYDKLQKEFTKVTQKNSELSKEAEKVKQWLEFDQYLDQLSQTVPDVKPQVGRMIDSFLQSLAKGDTPTQAQMGQLSKAIDKAEDKGDDETVQSLRALEETVMQTTLEKEFLAIEKMAESDGIEFDLDQFKEFADQWLEDLGIGEDDDFDLKLLRKAYKEYLADQLKEGKKKEIPPLGTSGGASAPDKAKEQKIGGLKGAFERAAKYLS